MKVRIRPPEICVRKVRIIRSASGADVVLALLLSMLLALTALLSFTMLCWKVGSELGALPSFPPFQSFLKQRESWLLMATLAWLVATIIDLYAAMRKSCDIPKSTAHSADELPADELRHFAVAPE